MNIRGEKLFWAHLGSFLKCWMDKRSDRTPYLFNILELFMLEEFLFFSFFLATFYQSPFKIYTFFFLLFLSASYNYTNYLLSSCSRLLLRQNSPNEIGRTDSAEIRDSFKVRDVLGEREKRFWGIGAVGQLESVSLISVDNI